MDPALNQLAQLSPQQRQAVMMQIQQEANQKIMREMTELMTMTCFKKCAGTSVSSMIITFTDGIRRFSRWWCVGVRLHIFGIFKNGLTRYMFHSTGRQARFQGARLSGELHGSFS